MIHCHENFRSSKTETLLFWPCSMSHGYIAQNFRTTYLDFITCNSNKYIQKCVVQNNSFVTFVWKKVHLCCYFPDIFTKSLSHSGRGGGACCPVWPWSFCTVSRANKPAAKHISNKNTKLKQVLWWFMRRRSWLRHCATSQKVTSSIPNGVFGIFHWHNPSGHTLALGLTRPLTEMSTRNISWGG